MTKDHEFVCKECGFTVPCDNEGVELIQQHLAEKHREADLIALSEDDEGG